MNGQTEYMRQYRENNPAYRQAGRMLATERRQAMETLRKRHAEEFAEILEEIRSARPRKPAGRPRASAEAGS